MYFLLMMILGEVLPVPVTYMSVVSIRFYLQVLQLASYPGSSLTQFFCSGGAGMRLHYGVVMATYRVS